MDNASMHYIFWFSVVDIVRHSKGWWVLHANMCIWVRRVPTAGSCSDVDVAEAKGDKDQTDTPPPGM